MYSKLKSKYISGSVQQLGWSSEESQRRRFEKLAEVNLGAEDSVLDIGSGYGDLYAFLKKQDLEFSYTGIEADDDFYRLAVKKYGRNLFMNEDFLRWTPQRTFSYCFASGLFWIKNSSNCLHMEALLKKMQSLSTKGFAFNVLSAHTNKKKILNYSILS